MSGTGDVGPADGGSDEVGSAADGPADGGSDEVGPAAGSSAASGRAEDGPAEGAAHEQGPANSEQPGRSEGGEDSAAGSDIGDTGSAGGGAHGGGPADSTTDGGSEGEGSADAAPAASGSGGAGTGVAAGATAMSAGSADPGELLGEVRAIRRRARLARHAYWLPLVLFGLLICASVPFYIEQFPRGRATYSRLPGPAFLQSGYLGGLGPISYNGVSYYWLGAMLLGVAVTVFWYRWRGNRVGLRTPARGYLITGLIIVALALLIPLADQGGGRMLLPGDLLMRGTFPLVLIGLGLCFLAWAERSAGLAVIAAVYLALALVASLYDIQNVFYNWFGVGLSPTVSALPNVLLPALVLLLAGAGAWVAQRRYRPPAESAPEG